MIIKDSIDTASPFNMSFGTKNKEFDWGKVSNEYALFRPPPPISFFNKLKALDIGLENQIILDLGTGTGHLALQLAKQNCNVTGVDISENQINYAKNIAKNQSINISFLHLPVENIDFSANSFDVITAMQSWPYFNKKVLYPKLKTILKPNGVIMIGNFDHLPRQDIIANETEKLMLKYNPKWKGHDYDGYIPPLPSQYEEFFQLKAMFYYDELIKFTNESWRGRIQASQAIGATLSYKERKKMDQELKILLNKITKDTFNILHRLSAHILIFK